MSSSILPYNLVLTISTWWSLLALNLCQTNTLPQEGQLISFVGELDVRVWLSDVVVVPVVASERVS
jgi:hypothetical protein